MKKGALLVNLGSPISPNPKDVKTYLYEFLLDKKVLDLPFLSRQLLVRGVIVPKRYKESAKSYEKIWRPEGAPLIYYSKLLEDYLQESLKDISIKLAMRYQQPSIENAIDYFKKEKITDLLLFPLFPQYAEATTGSIIDKVFYEMKKQNYSPKMQVITHFARDPFFIEALEQRVRERSLSDYDHIVISFHGLPLRQLKKMAPDHCGKANNSCCTNLCNANKFCYAAQCYSTAHSLAEKLELAKDRYSVAFQSRLGKEPWLEPYTSFLLKKLAREGKKRVLVVCPSFVADCLETIYEIGEEYLHLFRSEGGDLLHYVEGLNDQILWMKGVQVKIESAFDSIQPSFGESAKQESTARQFQMR